MKNIAKQSMRYMLTVGLLLVTAWAFAQTTVQGTVIDAANGEPIIGASILEIGTTNGTITDFDGNFELNVQPGAKLQFSYMGYKTQELAAQPKMAVKMGEDSELLDEVVVVGYGVVKKNDATGSVTAIKPDEMNKALTTTATDMISGKIAGVVVTSSGGAPGSGATIRIRGGSSLRASNDPLIVIDGLAMDNEGIQGVSNVLSMVNPNDIESMTVLKDASATAIYGSRASNGVIIITTKKGKSGQKPKFTYDGNVSASTLTDRIEVLTGDQMRAYANALGLGSTAMSVLGKENTDWQNAIYRTAISTDHNFSVMGGVKNNVVDMPYRASVGYTLGNGIVKTNQMQRVTASVNLNPSFLDNHLSFNLNAKGMYIYNRYADGVQGSALDMDPTQPIYDPDNIGFGGYYQRTTLGSYKDTEAYPGGKWYLTNNSQSAANPVASLMQKRNIANSGSFVGNLDATYKIHGFEDMILHANFGADYSYGRQTLDQDPEAFSDHYFGRYGYSEKSKYNLLFNCTAQYYKDFTEDQHFDIMVGYEWQHFKNNSVSEYYGLYPQTALPESIRGTQYDLRPADENRHATESYLVSFFGRMNWWGWNQIGVTATFRADGSSRFSPKNRWGLFPSVAVSWKIKESFMKDVNWLNDLKLRLSYGITGQQNLGSDIGDYPYMPTYTLSREYAFATLGQEATEAAIANLKEMGYIEGTDYVVSSDQYIYYVTKRPNKYNPDLTWEKTTTYNAGIDYAFLNNRINGSFDFYYRVTDDLINNVSVPTGTNFDVEITKNIGSLRNMGVEFSIDAVLIDRKNFKWDMTYNVTWNDNKITKLLDSDDPNYYIEWGGINNGQKIQAHKVGYAASSFYVYETKLDETTGQRVIVDRYEDGIIDDKDKYFYHNPAAPVTMGFSTKWQFYGFDLGMSFRASIGNYVYNQVLSGNMQNITANQVYDSKVGGFHNLLTMALNAHYNDGVQRANYGAAADMLDYYVENASFLRCDNITLGYSFEKTVKGRVYCTVSNPFVISRYRGLDPEVFGGIDSNIYPRSLTVTLGTTLNF